MVVAGLTRRWKASQKSTVARAAMILVFLLLQQPSAAAVPTLSRNVVVCVR